MVEENDFAKLLLCSMFVCLLCYTLSVSVTHSCLGFQSPIHIEGGSIDTRLISHSVISHHISCKPSRKCRCSVIDRSTLSCKSSASSVSRRARTHYSSGSAVLLSVSITSCRSRCEICRCSHISISNSHFTTEITSVCSRPVARIVRIKQSIVLSVELCLCLSTSGHFILLTV